MLTSITPLGERGDGLGADVGDGQWPSRREQMAGDRPAKLVERLCAPSLLARPDRVGWVSDHVGDLPVCALEAPVRARLEESLRNVDVMGRARVSLDHADPQRVVLRRLDALELVTVLGELGQGAQRIDVEVDAVTSKEDPELVEHPDAAADRVPRRAARSAPAHPGARRRPAAGSRRS